jgi:hypothetical protein
MKAQINAITLMMLSGVASVCATQISFDTAEGYADGALNGQPSRGGYIWNTDFNASGWQVENGAATVNSTINRWVGTRWSEPVSGTAISQSATFSLTRSGESALKGTTLFFLGITDAMERKSLEDSAGNFVLAGLGQSPGLDEYHIIIHAGLGQSKVQRSMVFKGAEIGLGGDGSSDTSGPLTLSVKHANREDDAWTTSATLSYDNTEIATVSLDYSAAEVQEWGGAPKFLLLSSADISLRDGTVINIDEVSIAADE